VSRPTSLDLVFRPIEEAEKSWRGINGPDKVKSLLEGVIFRDGEPVKDDQPANQSRRVKSLLIK